MVGPTIWYAVPEIVAARAEESGVHLRAAFSGREAGRLMSYPAVTVPASTSAADAIDDYFVTHRFTAFPVVEDGRPVGLVDLASLSRVPVERRPLTPVGDLAHREEELLIGEHQDVAELLERPAFRRVGRAVVVRADGSVGLVSISDVEQVMRALELAST